MPINLGDYEEDASNVNFKFLTKSTGDVPTTLLGTPVIAVYKANATGTEKTSAESYITLTVDFDSITGLNHVEIDLSGDSFFAFGEDYQVVITTGTVNAVSAVGTVLASFSIGRVATNVWDRVLTGATHNINNSAGKRLRLIEAGFILHQGTAQAGGANSITLDAGASAIDNFYVPHNILIIGGLGVEQVSNIIQYDGTTKVAKVTPPWKTVPDATSEFEVKPAIVHPITGWTTTEVGLAVASTATTITLNGDASTINDFYVDAIIVIHTGLGVGQPSRIITDYVGSTKIATINEAWLVTPDTTSEYLIEHAHPYSPILPLLVGLLPTSLSGGRMRSDIEALNGVAASAANLEKSASAIVRATIDDTVAPTTTVFEADDVTEATADHFNGRIIIFTSGALKDEATDITDYELSGGKGKFTVTAMTEAPANNDTFVIM